MKSVQNREKVVKLITIHFLENSLYVYSLHFSLNFLIQINTSTYHTSNRDILYGNYLVLLPYERKKIKVFG